MNKFDYLFVLFIMVIAVLLIGAAIYSATPHPVKVCADYAEKAIEYLPVKCYRYFGINSSGSK